jgi:quinol monooxygenase YgiN/mannose-6-phosphate isomerase-like protein (cupin superfamily)
MTRVGRYVKIAAKAGQGDALAGQLLQVADALRATPGCELYVINRAPDEPEVVWVTEVWSSQAELDAALQTEEAKAAIPGIVALVEGTERIDVVPVGGVGLDDPTPGHTIRNLADAEDLAATYGYGEMGEARFPSDDLEAEQTGLSHQRLRPGKRQMFAHRHGRAEEVYVVLSGRGRVRIEDEIVEVGPLDAIRVGPEETRAFEAGPEGLELLAFGRRARGDAQVVPDWWTD